MSAWVSAVSCFGILQGLPEKKVGMDPDPQMHLDAFPLTRPLLVRPSPEPSGGGGFTGLTGQPRCLEEREGGEILGGLVHGPARHCHYDTRLSPRPTGTLLPASDSDLTAQEPAEG